VFFKDLVNFSVNSRKVDENKKKKKKDEKLLLFGEFDRIERIFASAAV
jgi:hypothetical protein